MLPAFWYYSWAMRDTDGAASRAVTAQGAADGDTAGRLETVLDELNKA